MSGTDRDNPEARSTPAQTVQRLREASRERIEEHRRREVAQPARHGLREDPMMSIRSRPRRKRCKYCRYRFDYRMHTNRCPECGRYRDDYPHPNHGLHALLFATALVGTVSVVLVAVLVVRGM